jgi:DNA modification methylase
MIYVIKKTFTKEGDVVCDLFNGANTTGIRCEEYGREFYGYEINPDYFQQSIARTESVVHPEKKAIRKPQTQKIAA